MNDFTEIVIKYRSSEMTKSEREEFKRNLGLNKQLRKEFEFQKKIGKVLKQSLLLESIENNPDLMRVEMQARKDITDYLVKDHVNVGRKGANIFAADTETELQKMMAKAEVEMALSGIDDISKTWVQNFEKNKPAIERNIDSQKIIEYISKSEPFRETIIQMPSLSQKINRRIVLQVAAAVLVFSLLLFKAVIPSYTRETVYKMYYEPLDATSFRLRGSSNQVAGKLQEGVDYYLLKDYDKSELAFNELRKMNEKLPEVLLFSGLNQMGQENFEGAIKLFTDLLAADDQFVIEAQWYLGLCYIKTGEIQKASSLLETLSVTEGIYKKKAQLILKNLNK